MDDDHWSVQACGWAPCRGRHEVVPTTWDVPDAQPAQAPLAAVPAPREPEPAPVHA